MKDENTWLRPAESGDMEMLLEWANESDARLNSFSTGIITKEVHEKWLNDVLNSENTRLFIMMQENIPVGQIRLDVEGNAGIMSYSIAKKFRGSGLGKKIINMLEEWISENIDEEFLLKGLVKKSNSPSLHIFESCGYRKIETEEAYSFTKIIEPRIG